MWFRAAAAFNIIGNRDYESLSCRWMIRRLLRICIILRIYLYIDPSPVALSSNVSEISNAIQRLEMNSSSSIYYVGKSMLISPQRYVSLGLRHIIYVSMVIKKN